MTILNQTQLDLVRTRPHRTKLHLFVWSNPVVLAATVNDPSIAKGATTIQYANVSQGSYLNIIAGMTLYVGVSAGDGSLGRVRVRSATATQIVIAENQEIAWRNSLNLTVVKTFEPWAVYPNIVLSASNVPTFYKDTNIPYTDQNSSFDPIPMMGPHMPALIEPATGLARIYFDGSASYDMNTGGSITSYAWTFEGGSISSSSIATPGYVYWSQPGDYLVKLTVTNNLGKTFTGFRHIMIRTMYGGVQ